MVPPVLINKAVIIIIMLNPVSLIIICAEQFNASCLQNKLQCSVLYFIGIKWNNILNMEKINGFYL